MRAGNLSPARHERRQDGRALELGRAGLGPRPAPLEDAAALLELPFVKPSLRQRGINADVEDATRRGLAAPCAVEEGQRFVEQQVRVLHDVVGLWNELRPLSVTRAEGVKLTPRDDQSAGVAQRLASRVLALEEQHLKRLPPIRVECRNLIIHVLLEVEPVDDRVELEEHIVAAAHVAHAHHPLGVPVVGVASAPDGGVGGRHE